MEENQIQQSQINTEEVVEPEKTDNSEAFSQNSAISEKEIQQGQSETDPESELILGKFKSVEDLSKAYTELQKQQGASSKELGDLRKTSDEFKKMQGDWQMLEKMQGKMSEYLKEYREKYDTPEYFQDESFRKIYKEAFIALGQNLDTDKFINLLEGYVNSRISTNDKKRSAEKETQAILESMTYEKDDKSKLISPKKSFDEMTEKEIDEMLERII